MSGGFNANSFQFLNVTVSTPGTAQALAGHTIPEGLEVVLTARRSNTQNLYVAETAAKAQSGARKVLVPGQSFAMRIDRTDRIYYDADNSNDVLEVTLQKAA